MNIPRILLQIRPNARWAMNGITYEGIIWLDEVQVKPTLAEIETAWPSVQAEIAAELAEKQSVADDIVANLPSWSVVETAVNNIANLAEAKVFLLKLSKVVYQHIKGTTNGGS